jgi:hypothetical protein
MSDKLLTTYLEPIRRAAADANNFIEGMNKEDLLADKRPERTRHVPCGHW